MRNRHHVEIKQKKSMSQIFLNVDWPCKKIAAQLSSVGIDDVLEIGPGNGILTRELLAAGMQVTSVEKDPRFVAHLGESLKTYPKFEIIEHDILHFDLADWLKTHSAARTAVCGNIPYHISTPVVMWLLPHLDQMQTSMLMFQLEFAKRLTAAPNSKDYGSLSVFAQLRARVDMDFKVERTCFTPAPKVDSAVVSMLRRPAHEPAAVLRNVEIVTRQAFSQRRKRLSNSLGPLLKDFAGDLPIDLGRRCETLSPEEFVLLAKLLLPT